MSIEQLTKGCIEEACVSGTMRTGAVVQCIQVGENGKVAISDGIFATTAVCYGDASEALKNKQITENSIICINGSTVSKNGSKVRINLTNIEVVQLSVPQILGEPKKWAPGAVSHASAAPNAAAPPPPPKPAAAPAPATVPSPQKPKEAPTRVNQNLPIHKVVEISNYLRTFSLHVRVTSCQFKQITTKSGSPMNILTVILTDKTGSIKGTFFNDEALKFKDIIKEDKVYLIQDGQIKYADKRFNQTRHDFEINFTKNTRVEEDTNVDPNEFGKAKFFFVKLDEVQRMEANKTVDVIAVITEIQNAEQVITRQGRETLRRRCFIADDSNVKMEIVSWGNECHKLDNLTEGAVVAFKGLKINKYNEKTSLVYQDACSHIVDPSDLPETKRLKEWASNGDSLSNLQESTGQVSEHNYHTPLIYLDVITKEELGLNSAKSDYFDVVAFLSDIPVRKNMFYLACPNSSCKNKKVTQRDDGTFFCDKCKQIYEDTSQVVPRFSFSFRISDFSGSAYVNALGDDPSITRLLGMNASQFREKWDELGGEENSTKISEEIINPIRNQPFKFRIRAHPNEYNGQVTPRLQLQSCSAVSFGEMAKIYASEINNFDNL